MKIEICPLELNALDELRCEVVLVPYFADEKPVRGLGELIDWRQYGKISRMQQSGVMTGQTGETTLVALGKPLRVPKAIFFGLGDSSKEFSAEHLSAACSGLQKILNQADLRAIALCLPGRSTRVVESSSALKAWLEAMGAQSSALDLIIFDETAEHAALRSIAKLY
jgi:hypothetical protein